MDGKTAKAYRALKDSGASVQKHNQIRFNSGSETSIHLVAKALAAQVGIQHGYRASSEVDVPDGEIDVLLWGHPERLTYAVELERSPTEQIKKEKVNKYVRKVGAVDDMILINCNDLPTDVLEMRDHIQEAIGL